MLFMLELIREHPIIFSILAVLIFISHYYSLYKFLTRRRK